MKDCKYPNCQQCENEDCDMEQKDINALLKRRRYHADVEKSRQKRNEYMKKVRDNLPHCDECEMCVLVMGRTGEHLQRLCVEKMRLIERKVSNCPRWCERREKKRNGKNKRNPERREALLEQSP